MHVAPTIADGLVLVTQPIIHNIVSHTALITYAVHDTGGGTAPQTIANDVQGAFDLRIMNGVDADATSGKPTVLVGDGSNVPAVAIGAGDPTVGGAAATYPPPNVAVLAKKVTGFGGRANRGRTYFPWMVSEAAVDEKGMISAGQVSDLQNQFSLFLADLAGAALPMVIANRTMAIDGETGRPYVAAYTLGKAVTQLICEQYVATQRRRMPRPG